jgi:hypothetical protein
MGVKRPKILLVSKQVHDLCLIRILKKRLKRWHDAFDRRAIAYDINSGKDYPAVKIHQRIVAGKILGPSVIQEVVDVPDAVDLMEIATQHTNPSFI